MLRYCICCFFCLLSLSLFAQGKKTAIQKRPPFAGFVHFPIADSVRAIGFYSEFTIEPNADKRDGSYLVAGFSRGAISFYKKGVIRCIKMVLRDTGLIQGGNDVRAVLTGKGENITVDSQYHQVYNWKYAWKTGVAYKVMISALPDSASRTTIYAGYVFLPESRKWKLIASAKVSLDGGFLRGLFVSKENGDARDVRSIVDTVAFAGNWLQRSNGSWLELSNRRPIVDLAQNIDSTAQVLKDRQEIFAAVAQKKIDTTGSKEGVFYHLLKEGSGETVSVTDTVTVFYKGYLLKDGSIFDQTKDKPATFPLRRLIRGWQLAIPMSRVGGTVRIFIPSGQAYGIRARSKDIPPNSVLVFDVEVVSTRKAVGL